MSGAEIQVIETSMTRQEARVAGARNDLRSAKVRLERAFRQQRDAQWELDDAERELHSAMERLRGLGEEV